MPLTLGSWLGPYEVLSHLCSGGMGEVYRALDPRLRRGVAFQHISQPSRIVCDGSSRKRARLVSSIMQTSSRSTTSASQPSTRPTSSRSCWEAIVIGRFAAAVHFDITAGRRIRGMERAPCCSVGPTSAESKEASGHGARRYNYRLPLSGTPDGACRRRSPWSL